MKTSGSYRDLIIWQKGMALAKVLYGATRNFPKEEQFGLVSQIRRAVVSIPSNIAEGQARKSKKEFIHFLYIAKGSLAELDTQCTLSCDLGYTTEDDYHAILENIAELQRMIYATIRSLTG